MEDNTDLKHKQRYWLPVVKNCEKAGRWVVLFMFSVPGPLWGCESAFPTLFNSSYRYTCVGSSQL